MGVNHEVILPHNVWQWGSIVYVKLNPNKLSYQPKTLSKVAKEFLKNYLTEFSTGLLTACLMPSDSRNSIMAKTTGFIFSLFNVASAREMPFAIPLYMQCILCGLTSVLLCVPFITILFGKLFFV